MKTMTLPWVKTTVAVAFAVICATAFMGCSEDRDSGSAGGSASVMTPDDGFDLKVLTMGNDADINNAWAAFVTPVVGWVTMCTYPDGSSTKSFNSLGAEVDPTIRVYVGSDGIPAERVRMLSRPLDAPPRNCGGMVYADGPSVDGFMYFSFSNEEMKVFGVGEGSWDRRVTFQYKPWADSDTWYTMSTRPFLQLSCTDLNGDGVINLADQGIFTSMFYNGTYDWEADFNHDGVENLVDVGLYSGGLGASCPK